MTTVELRKQFNRMLYGICYNKYTKKELDTIDSVLKIASNINLLQSILNINNKKPLDK